MQILILGCGFTGSRVAELCRSRGWCVTCIRRGRIDFTQPGSLDQLRGLVAPGCVVLHSVPSLPDSADARLVTSLGGASRVVYLSTTGVYGAADSVDATTQPAPRNEREVRRVETERAVAQGAWSSLILRPAAIYGPGRGVHVSMREGRYTLSGDGSNVISRIHVDDLARIAFEALSSTITGAYPVADEHACSSREIAEFCSRLLAVPMPPSVGMDEIPLSRRGNRRVDGAAIRELLGVKLRYPSYKEGIPASVAAESDRSVIAGTIGYGGNR